MEVNWFALDL